MKQHVKRRLHGLQPCLQPSSHERLFVNGLICMVQSCPSILRGAWRVPPSHPRGMPYRSSSSDGSILLYADHEHIRVESDRGYFICEKKRLCPS